MMTAVHVTHSRQTDHMCDRIFLGLQPSALVYSTLSCQQVQLQQQHPATVPLSHAARIVDINCHDDMSTPSQSMDTGTCCMAVIVILCHTGNHNLFRTTATQHPFESDSWLPATWP
jgi:hypothetical protein